MNELTTLMLAGAAGLSFGAVFFAGLWWSVRKGLSSSRPALWFLGSLLLRTAIVVAGFYFVAGGRWQRLVCCLFGFIFARWLVFRIVRLRAHTGDLAGKEVSHAP